MLFLQQPFPVFQAF
uniref:Uncharacterized protein n=1 Tax=Anguilla anguilla TaxID=7936 RepID=A0A0E9TQ74_ANGAN